MSEPEHCCYAAADKTFIRRVREFRRASAGNLRGSGMPNTAADTGAHHCREQIGRGYDFCRGLVNRNRFQARSNVRERFP
jgi:hypothetical protein